VIRRLPGNVMSPNPMRNSGNPPGPGTSGPITIAVRMSSQPKTFLTMNQNQLAKTDGLRWKWGCAYERTPGRLPASTAGVCVGAEGGGGADCEGPETDIDASESDGNAH
jgi:hypothetical protein